MMSRARKRALVTSPPPTPPPTTKRKSSKKQKNTKSGESEKQLEPQDNDKNDNNGELTSSIRLVKTENRKGATKDQIWVCSCPYCSGEYGDLKSHIRHHHPGKQWNGIKTKCPKCPKVVVDIMNHIKYVHEKVRNFTCSICDKSFHNKTVLSGHMESVHQKVTDKCPLCGLEMRAKHIKTHMKRVHENERAVVKCDIPDCDKTYTSKADMQRHVLRVHLKHKEKCPYCDEVNTADNLRRHIKTQHQGIYKLYCKICHQGLESTRSREMHMSTHHSGIFLQCNIPTVTEESQGEEESKRCGRKFATEIALKEHIVITHLKKDHKVKCEWCGVEFYSCYQHEHNAKYHSKSLIHCDFDGCDATFDSRDELPEHTMTCHGSLLEYLDWCNKCQKPVLTMDTHNQFYHKEINDHEFTLMHRVCIGEMCPEEGCKFFGINRGSVNRHMRLTHDTKIKTVCDICQKATVNIMKHMKDEHGGKVHKCEICESTFDSKKKLVNHKRVHTREKKECNICGMSVVHIKQHMDQVHGNERPLSCDVEGCLQRFFNKTSKRKHMLHVHEGMKYKCKLCGQNVSHLRSHIRHVHEKVKNHECPECHKKFHSSTYLRLHIARLHLGVKEYCEECDKEVQDLNSHNLHVHKRAKNFPCDLCDRRFQTLNQLQVHIMSKHIKSDKIMEMRSFIAGENKENAPANENISIAEEDNGIEC